MYAAETTVVITAVIPLIIKGLKKIFDTEKRKGKFFEIFTALFFEREFESGGLQRNSTESQIAS